MRGLKVLFWLAQLAGVAATVWLLWFSDTPLGVSNEWVWDRMTFDAGEWNETKLGWGVAAIATVVYLLFCAFADRRVLEASRTEMASWLVALIVIGTAWHGIVQECPPVPHRLSKVPWVLWHTSSQGYYAEARYRSDDLGDYLAKYADRMKEGDIYHFGTHPPGFVLLHRTIIGVVRWSPTWQRWLLDYQPDSVRASWKVLNELENKPDRPVTELDNAALWLSGLLAAMAAMSTVVPLFILLQRECGRETCWRLVCLWPLVPALAVFHPVSDLWLPFFATSFLTTWLYAWSWRSISLSMLAGLVMYCGMFLSLAMLPVAFLAALWTIADFLFSEAKESFKSRLKLLAIGIAAAVGTFAVLTLLTWWLGSINLASVRIQNLRNHAAFYLKHPRTYSSWLLVNPVELTLAAGTPIVLAAIATWLKGTRGCLKSRQSLAGFRLWVLVTLMVLLLSGKNSGEAARLWIFLMPWLLWVAGHEEKITAKIVNGPGQTLPEYTGTPARGWLTLMILQAIVCAATVSRVDGFHFKTTVPLPSAAPSLIEGSIPDRQLRRVGLPHGDIAILGGNAKR